MTDSEKLDRLLMQMQGLKENVQGLKENVQGMQEDVQDLKEDVQGLREDVQNLQKKMDILDIRVTKVELTLENEISVNIRRVAEGHLDLSRNLHECVKLASDIKSKQEIQDIFIATHNNKLKML
ncbi:MAG: hypothetical protein HFG25_12435 [Lachnospiraceae bacterium]|jgi:chromosome segregation ATPase|nr:hypothetical protein [Lachnospiraceae bacterium]